MNEKKPDSQRQPLPIIPTHPPPPPPAVPDPDEEQETPPTQRMTSPPHAPSQRPGGRAKVQRRESPPEGTPVIIDSTRRGSLAHDRKTGARAQAGVTGAISGANITIVG